MVCLLRWLFARADKRHPHGGQLEKKPEVSMASTTRAGSETYALCNDLQPLAT